MLHGLKALHLKNIFHRDIKSANIFMTKNCEEVKLGDMNVSVISKNGMASTQTGTPYYTSP
jgi:NIMA (never in mitosis gene a)-related kinase 1/4/5